MLRIDSGIIIFIFDERENLRIFPFIFFTREVVEENCLSTVALFPMKKSKGTANAVSVYDPFPVKK